MPSEFGDSKVGACSPLGNLWLRLSLANLEIILGWQQKEIIKGAMIQIPTWYFKVVYLGVLPSSSLSDKNVRVAKTLIATPNIMSKDKLVTIGKALSFFGLCPEMECPVWSMLWLGTPFSLGLTSVA